MQHVKLYRLPWSIMHAKSWIERLFNEVVYSSWVSPNVTLGPDGEVVFEWWHDTKKLTIYIMNDDSEYVQVWGSDIHTDMMDGNAESIDVCKILWMWLRN